MNKLEEISGIGPKYAQLLSKLGINDINDLIHYYPFRYNIIKRSDISTLMDGDKVTIDGIIEGQPTTIFLNQHLRKIIFRINTGKGIFNITLYNQNYLYNELRYGKEVTIIGKYNRIKNTVVATEIRFGLLKSEPLIEPVYYTTSGLPRKNIAKFISSALQENIDIIDYIPDYLKNKYSFMEKARALMTIHEPSDVMMLRKAKQRLKYEELFLYLLKINYMKRRIKEKDSCIERHVNYKKISPFIKSLPFTLTEDQKVAVNDILADLNAHHRMNRLLQGDVGSGKTVIAFIATYINYLSGYQTAIMVPTEILAKQHYEEAMKLFKEFNLKVALLTGSTSSKDRGDIYRELASAKIDLVIGTQTLVQDKLTFNNLGLVITDEQHRFGVRTRETFRNKGEIPDMLSMSATPIPRTYALTIYGDMDISSIKSKPKGRKDIITYFKREKDITDVLNMMKEQLDLHHQVYVIAPAILDGEEESDRTSVSELETNMTKAFGKLFTIGIVHGGMDAKEKEDSMKKFESGETNILISTTVIEVGINVPNATMIVIFNANLFGLSTIHQLRGRVGRGDSQSYCILLAKESYERLKFLETTNDGFEVSEYDFKNRGEGDLFGVRQSGETGLVLANVNRDYNMMARVKEDVDGFMDMLVDDKNDKYSYILNEIKKVKDLD